MASLSIPAGMTEKEYFETAASEADFLKWYKEQDLPTYETPSVTADMVAYCFVEGKLKLLAIRRKAHPYQHRLALVGGFVNKDEDATHACIREVKEEVGLDLPVNKVEQLLTVSTPGRDPRGWVITIAHLVYLPAEAVDLAHAGDDAKEVVFLDVDFKQMKKLLKNWVNPSSSQKDKPLLSAIKLLMIFISFLLTIRGRHLRVWRILPLMVKVCFQF